MPCKHYKGALIETAASGADPQGDLRAHLDGCAECRSAFEQERSIFASIDGGLHVAANAEVPASLLPRVRARLDEESAPRRIWATNLLVLASAAVLFVVLLATRALWRPNAAHQPVETTVKVPPPQHATAPSQKEAPGAETPVKKNDVANQQLFVAKRHSAFETLVKGNTTPEVLVPHDQELLLAEYAQQWSLHKRPLLLAQEFDATVLSPLQVAPIQIDELGVKLLAEEKLQ
jgi:hypothetical protein